MNFFNKRIIFLIYKGNYRDNALGNFGKSRIYKNFVIINLSGKLSYLFGKFLNKFNIGNFIALDGTPFLTNKKNSINLWFGGTYMKIIKKFSQYENNYTNIINPAILKNEKYFDIYPISRINKISFNKNRKIIFMGKFYFKPDDKHYFNEYRLNNIKCKVLNNFKLIESKSFWDEHLPNHHEKDKFDNYKILKTYIRKEILKIINIKFHKKLYIYNNEQVFNNSFQILQPTYDLKKIEKIYSGNICLDTGSLAGSTTYSPRAIQILESGGVLLQTWQQDSKKKLEIMFDDIACTNIEQLLQKIDFLLRDDNKYMDFINKSRLFLLEGQNKFSKTLDNVFN